MSYLTRLTALKATIAPQQRLLVLIVKGGETHQAALVAYAKSRGIAIIE